MNKYNELTAEEKRVIIDKGTERPGTGEYNDHKEPGVYVCRQCNAQLYKSEDKFASGCGWPSFYEQISSESINKKIDLSFGMSRTEILCAKCDAHLGHIFNDGPNPTGQRYCVNSLSIDYKEGE